MYPLEREKMGISIHFRAQYGFPLAERIFMLEKGKYPGPVNFLNNVFTVVEVISGSFFFIEKWVKWRPLVETHSGG